MAGAFDQRKLGVRIILGAVIGVLGIGMLSYLLPTGPTADSESNDTVAKIGDQTVSLAEVRQQLSEIERRNQVPKPLEGLYARQILTQLVYTKEVQYEANRLGIKVTNEEIADRVKQFLPTAFNGDSPVGMDQYTQQVQQRFGMTVPVFEDLIKQGLLEEKFRRLVTDGVSAGPNELMEQFRYQNEKVKLNYALIKPEDLEAKITPSDAEIKEAYEKSKSQYQIPEKRAVEYGLVDLTKLRQSVQISDDELKVKYQQDIAQYQVPNRVHAQHILFMTVGKPDAEVDEIKKKAEDALKQAKKGAKFDQLAKKYSEDPGTKDKGGDLGWIVQGQTVPEFEKAAFSQQPGSISDLVKTQYGFHIIKVLGKEIAHTKPFDKVKDSIRAPQVLPSHQGSLEEVRDKIVASLKQEKAQQAARSKAEELSKRAKAGEKFDAAAKALGLDPKTSDEFSRAGSIPGVGSGKQVSAAFGMKAGDVSAPQNLGLNWLVYRVETKTEANPA